MLRKNIYTSYPCEGNFFRDYSQKVPFRSIMNTTITVTRKGAGGGLRPFPSLASDRYVGMLSLLRRLGLILSVFVMAMYYG